MIPVVTEKSTSAGQSVSQEKCLMERVAAFTAEEELLSSAVPSASFTGGLILALAFPNVLISQGSSCRFACLVLSRVLICINSDMVVSSTSRNTLWRRSVKR